MNLRAEQQEHQHHAGAGDCVSDVSPDLVHVTRSLHEKFDARLGRDLIDREIRLSAAQFTDAHIRAFVPLFVDRFCGAPLCAHAGPSFADHRRN